MTFVKTHHPIQGQAHGGATFPESFGADRGEGGSNHPTTNPELGLSLLRPRFVC
jgi:hypothetical protein